jgi:hypothetical protein
MYVHDHTTVTEKMPQNETYTIRLDENLKARMNEHDEINWSAVMRQAVQERLDGIEAMDRIAAKSTLTEEEASELATLINKRATATALEELATFDDDHGPTTDDQLKESERGDNRSSETGEHTTSMFMGKSEVGQRYRKRDDTADDDDE